MTGLPRRAAARTPVPSALVLLLGLLATTACGGDDPTVPQAARVTVATLAGDGQLGAAGLKLVDPLQVVVTDAVTEKPVAGVRVRFVLREGTQATLTPVEASTDALGVASASLVLGAALGTYRVEASAEGMVGAAAAFTAQAVPVPTLNAVEPGAAMPGDTLLLTGTNFRPTAAENRVTIGSLNAAVATATATTLRVVMPACVPNRILDVRVLVGSAVSGTRTITGVSTADGTALARGEVRTLATPQALACFRLAGDAAGAGYYVSVLNAADALAPAPRLEVLGLRPGSAALPLLAPAHAAAPMDAATAFEFGLRARERAFPAGAFAPPAADHARLARVPQVGDRRTFNVINRQNRFETVTAEARVVSQRAVIYQDLEAPAGGFTTADLQVFGNLFDNPIHATVTEAFGQPSDLDGNDRVVILLTPKVNALTESGQSSFIAGYFYGCDLVSKEACSGTNRGEIFYSMVPDPQGTFGNVRSTSLVLRTVPGVLAHEFQHMVNFAAKGGKVDALWLSEALAHMAEDLVGDALVAAGRGAEADDFRLPNWNRALHYLADPAAVSLLSNESPGTLAFRGGAWLLVKYAVGQAAAPATLLRTLAASPRTSVDNFTAATGRPWGETLTDFSVALWADGAPELEGATVAKRFTFPNLDLRGTIGGSSAGYPLRPEPRGFEDFATSRTLPAGSFDPFLLRTATGVAAPDFNLVVAGPGGAPLPAGSAPALAVLRYR